jgi:magnesium-transporting ATPase (P-type)
VPDNKKNTLPEGQGLTSDEARSRLLEAGRNETAAAHRTTALAQLAREFTNPLVVILLVASFISMAAGSGLTPSSFS